MNGIKLRRSITWLQGAALTVGAVLGSGVLVLPSMIAAMAGPASLVAWLLMGVLALPVALTLGELASNYPEAGGIAAYSRRAFGPAAGTIAGWLFTGTVPVGAPVAALIGANYVGTQFSLSLLQTNLLAGSMLAGAVFFNYRGIRLSGTVQVVVVSTIAIMLGGAVVAAAPRVEAAAFTPFAPSGWRPIGVAMTTLFWAFVGWEMVVHLAEEFKDPARDIKTSLLVSSLIVNVLYLSLAFVTVGTRAYLGPAGGAALAALVGDNWGRWAGVIMAALGFAVCYGTIHTYVAGFSRLVYAQARQGDFPGVFARIHPRFQTPYGALLALVPIFGFVLALNYLRGLNIDALMRLPSTIFIVLYMMAMASAIRLLPSGSGRWLAGVSLAMCLGVYTFTGWAGVYPFIIAGVGLLAGRRNRVRG